MVNALGILLYNTMSVGDEIAYKESGDSPTIRYAELKAKINHLRKFDQELLKRREAYN